MAKSYDAIIIGAGIIGCATSLALGRKGWKVLNLDRLPAAGYGSTSGSCAIIRPYYSTLDGSAMAYESHFYWKNWAEYLGGEDIDERGLIEYHNVGSLVMKTEQNDYMRPTMALMDQLDSPYSELNAEEMRRRAVSRGRLYFRSAAGDAQHHARGATGRWRVYL
jgi:sarcosine oxidase subunit beta